MTVNKNNLRPIFFWLFGMILCPLGVAFSAKSGFGVSMIEAPVFALYRHFGEIWSWYTFGTSEYILQGIVLLLLCILIRRFRWRYLLSFVTAYIFGLILDGWYLLLGHEQYANMYFRIASAVIGLLLTSCAVAFFFRTWLPQEVWELFVKEFSERYRFNMTKVKYVYDFTSLAVGIVLMIAFFGSFRLDIIGYGTLVTTLVNAPLIGFFGKIQDKIWPCAKG